MALDLYERLLFTRWLTELLLQSDKSFELETRGPRTRIQVGSRRSKGTLDAMTMAAGGSPDRQGRMTIVVQQRVEQTYEGRGL